LPQIRLERPAQAGDRQTTTDPPLPGGEAGGGESLAQAYFDAMTDVFQRPNTRLYDWLRVRLAARRVRGLVLWHYVGCDLWRAEAQSLREGLGLPVLLLDADETAAASARSAGRIAAFVECLQ
jgi:benzoyl-CoA reductase/2-hydroxyglutaryl-CoA dehydratase subunit BcrC/BadD/HgdB